MKSIITTLCLFCWLVSYMQAQTISNVNFDEVKVAINKGGSSNYQRLLKRVLAADTNLTLAEYRLLYFGQVFQSGYNPYSDVIALQAADALIKQGKSEDALPLVDSYLKSHPISLDAIYTKLTILYQQKKMNEMNPLVKRLQGLTEAIISSGDGKTDKTAMVVTYVADEYQVMSYLRVESTRQALIHIHNTQCDKMTLAQPNNSSLTELYFNVSKPYATLSKGMK